jgi:hypothetical protein
LLLEENMHKIKLFCCFVFFVFLLRVHKMLKFLVPQGEEEMKRKKKTNNIC